MYNRQRAWLWFSAAVSFIVGLILVMNDSSAGWFLVIMGIIYIGVSTRAGQGWAASNPQPRPLGAGWPDSVACPAHHPPRRSLAIEVTGCSASLILDILYILLRK